MKSQLQWRWHILFNMKNVRSKLSSPVTKWVKVWTSIRTGGSGDLSVLLAAASIAVMEETTLDETVKQWSGEAHGRRKPSSSGNWRKEGVQGANDGG